MGGKSPPVQQQEAAPIAPPKAEFNQNAVADQKPAGSAESFAASTVTSQKEEEDRGGATTGIGSAAGRRSRTRRDVASAVPTASGGALNSSAVLTG